MNSMLNSSEKGKFDPTI